MNIGPLVMAVDDEPGMLRLLRMELSSQKFRVALANDAHEALRVAEEQRPDIALLDIVMPEVTGIELMQQLHRRMAMPVILLTALGGEEAIVRGLQHGADDYVVKPFDPDELMSRVRAVLRRARTPSSSTRVVRSGGLEVDLNRRLVFREGKLLPLTRSEWMLLECLACYPGKLMLNGWLLGRVWGPDYRDQMQYLRVWISRLRKKIEPDPAHPSVIRTVQGVGYMFLADGIDPEAAAAPAN